MKTDSNFYAIQKLICSVACIDVITFVTVAFVCLLAGLRTVYEYGDALVKTGVVLFIAVLLIGIGGNSGRAEDIQDLSWTRSMRMEEYLVRSASERNPRSYFVLVGVIAMAIVIVVGSILLKMP